MKELFERLGKAQDQAVQVSLAAPAISPIAASPGALGKESRRARPARFAATIGVSAALALAAAVALFWWPPRERTITVTAGDMALQANASIEARSADVPVRFSDGSVATLRSGSQGRVLALQPHGAEFELIEGGLVAHVVHADRTRWRFRAGPFAVAVTGTRFEVVWSPSSRQLTVVLYEGGVTVDGAVLGAGLPLRAGQRLRVGLAEGAVQVKSLSSATTDDDDATGQTVPATPAVDESGGVSPPDRAPLGRASDRSSERHEDWRTLAERGAHLDAWREAQRAGLDRLRQRLDVGGLLALADVARYADEKVAARAVFLTLVERFPRHHLAGDAIFSLGRLASEAGNPREATQWFARYQTQFPAGALIAEANGRLLEAAVARDDAAGARAAAASYLARTPDGPYAPLARQVLATPADQVDR